MNGAELLIRTAVDLGIRVCFANAGTTEMPVVRALDSVSGIRAYLGLFEGVCTGAADGYGRMLDRPAMTLLHLGPGFANGIANLHNARRAGSPVLNIIGEHASWHRAADPPLAMDIEGLVQTVSGWWKTSMSPGEIAADVIEAVRAANQGRVATIIFPHDYQLAECPDPGKAPAGPSGESPRSDSVEHIADRLKRSPKSAMILGGRALRRRGLDAAARIRKKTGCDLYAPMLPGYMERGAGLPVVNRVPYFPEQAVSALSRYEIVLLAGAQEPVTFFGYPGVRSRILSDRQEVISICPDPGNVVEALECLAEALKGPRNSIADGNDLATLHRPDLPRGELTVEKSCLTIAALQPEHAIVVDESVTASAAYSSQSAGLPPHTLLCVSGGSIGLGIPCAAGAAIACPDRPVLSLEADGSALYTVQGLWTQAREGLNVTTLIFSNGSYRILQMELNRSGEKAFGQNTRNLIDLKKPDLNWVEMARGFGVPGVRVCTVDGLKGAFLNALSEPGPHLIEMVVP